MKDYEDSKELKIIKESLELLGLDLNTTELYIIALALKSCSERLCK